MYLIISAFPGTGKYHFYKNTKSSVSFSDGTMFLNDSFPNNYLDHIKKMKQIKDIVLISTHKSIRELLVRKKLRFFLVYPERSLKSDYIERCKEFKYSKEFIETLEHKWDDYLDDIEVQEDCIHIVLKKCEFITDVISKTLIKIVKDG